MSHPDPLGESAARLAEEGSGRPLEWLEERILSALAEERARMWQRSRLNDPGWPAQGRAEAQQRFKEAVAVADAIRAGVPLPPPA